MKRTLTLITFSVLIWSCSHKSTPTASKGTTSAATASVANAPATAAPVAATTVPVPATPAETSATKSPEMLGQATFTAKCGRCHGLKNTADFTADRWVGIMESMAQKARLDDSEKQNVLAYVKANAKK